VTRALALDFGSVRIGVAVSDASGTLATPHGTIRRTGDRAADNQAIVRLVDELGAEVVIVGLPLSLDGSRGPAAVAVEEEVAALRDVLAVAVETHDERLSTAEAARSLTASGRAPRRQRDVIDAAAAAVVLQSWLDARRSGASG